MSRSERRYLEWRVPPESAGVRLDQFVSEQAKISKSEARAIIVQGAVYLNTRRVRIASKPLIVGARVGAYVSGASAGAQVRARSVQPLTAVHILYEDAWLIAIDKPVGLPSQPTVDQARYHLVRAVADLLKARDGLKQDPYLGLHHRLDAETSGVIVLAKHRDANAGLALAFAERLALKRYLAWCVPASTAQPSVAELGARDALDRRWHVQNRLGPRDRVGGKQRFGAVARGGDAASTEFLWLRSEQGAHLIEAKPLTGRTHQIRVHLSECGWPILGDALYGGLPAKRMWLHASRLELPHPVPGPGRPERVVIESPLRSNP